MTLIYSKAIAADHGKPSGRVLIWDELKELMELRLVDVLGPYLELRRWWSVYDNVAHIMPLWHTMLLSLMVQYLMNGENPFKILQTARPVILRGDDRGTKNFKYKHQVLLALFDGQTRRLMVSMTIVFKRIRTHHARVTDDATNPKAGLRYLQLWADHNKWVKTMVQPTVKDSVNAVNTWRRLGITRTMSTAEAPLLDAALTKVLLQENSL